MKKCLVTMILAAGLFGFLVSFAGCSGAESKGGAGYSQNGETQMEGHRRHIRNLRLNQRSLMEDVDVLMLFDRPSRLSERRIP